MKSFNRSEFMRSRHSRAKQQKDFFEELTGQKTQYSEFLKEETPLYQKVVAYDVSYQLSYSSSTSSLFIKSPETYRVYAIENELTSQRVYQNTKDAVLNMKSKLGNGFQIETQKMINDKLEVNVTRIDPRGIEKTENFEINEKIVNNLKNKNGFYVESVDSPVKVKGGRSNKITREAEMKTDLSLYFG